MKLPVLDLVCRLSLLALLGCGQAQESLHARVDLTKSGHRLKDASRAVVWLTPMGLNDAVAARERKFGAHPKVRVS